MLQLAGEILLDIGQYTEAAHCYTLAAQASREAGDLDLWACALTRHAYIALYDRASRQASQLTGIAGELAAKGDPALCTRYWVAVVQAQAHAEMGESTECRRALDLAELVQGSQNGGWLRFDASRIPEERGACLVALGDQRAEDALLAALTQNLPPRRRGTIYADLAMAGATAKDTERVRAYTEKALDIACLTNSAVIARRLARLQPSLPGDLQHRVSNL